MTAVDEKRSPRASRAQILGALAGATVVLVPLLVVAHARSGDPHSGPRPLPAAVSGGGLVDRSGVRVVRVAATGGGGLLDLRYQVVDPGKAYAVHASDTPPALVDEKSGLVVSALLMGHMHHGAPKAGITYYLLFVNQGNAVHRGDRVAVVLGDARLEHVLVQ